MGRTVCTEPQCLYKGALYLYLTVELYLYSPMGRTACTEPQCQYKGDHYPFLCWITAEPEWRSRCSEQLQEVSSGFRISVRSRDFSKKYRPSLEINYPQIYWALGLFPTANGPGSKFIHSLQYKANYRNMWSCTSVPTLGFQGSKCNFNS
jgi:hypothetical protein